MSSKTRKAVVLLGFVLILVASGCSSSSSTSSSGGGAVFVTESGQHISGWLNRNSGNFHADAFLATPQKCTECHGAALLGGISGVSCNSVSYDGRSCHPGNDPPHLSPVLNLDGTIRSDNIKLLCGKCHDLNNFQSNLKFQCQRCHASSSDTSDPLNGTLKDQYPLPFPYGFGSAPNVKLHDSTVVGTKYGNWVSECVTCHNPHAQEQDNAFGTSYGKYIKRFLSYFNNVTGETLESFIQFTSPTGTGSFADGPPHDENICEMCHTRTNHHQRDGTAPGGQEHFSGLKCTQCHSHGGGFAFSFGGQGLALPPPHDTEPFVNNCDYCHVNDGEGNIDFSAEIPNAKCHQCHSEDGGLKTDFPSAPNVLAHSGKACVECHNPMWEQDNLALIRSTIDSSVIPESTIVFRSFRGEGSFADGPPHEENVCETCHSMTNHHQYDGTAPGGQSHFDGLDCTALCHTHAEGIIAPTTPVPDLHHLRVGTPIIPGSVVLNSDADSDGVPDATYNCLNCHSDLLFVERDCTQCHN